MKKSEQSNKIFVDWSLFICSGSLPGTGAWSGCGDCSVVEYANAVCILFHCAWRVDRCGNYDALYPAAYLARFDFLDNLMIDIRNNLYYNRSIETVSDSGMGHKRLRFVEKSAHRTDNLSQEFL